MTSHKRIRSLINHMYFSKGRFCHDRNHFPVFFATSDRACGAHLYWTFDRVRLCTLGAMIKYQIGLWFEAPWGSLSFKNGIVLLCSKMPIGTMPTIYIPIQCTIYVQIFATESSTFGPNQSSYSRAASALTDIVSVGVIVEPQFILSWFYDALFTIYM